MIHAAAGNSALSDRCRDECALRRGQSGDNVLAAARPAAAAKVHSQLAMCGGSPRREARMAVADPHVAQEPPWHCWRSTVTRSSASCPVIVPSPVPSPPIPSPPRRSQHVHLTESHRDCLAHSDGWRACRQLPAARASLRVRSRQQPRQPASVDGDKPLLLQSSGSVPLLLQPPQVRRKIMERGTEAEGSGTGGMRAEPVPDLTWQPLRAMRGMICPLAHASSKPCRKCTAAKACSSSNFTISWTRSADYGHTNSSLRRIH